MRYTYLAEALEGDPIVGRLYAMPMEKVSLEEGGVAVDETADSEVVAAAYQLDLTATADGWTHWFVDVPSSGTEIDEAEVASLAGTAGLPPGA